VGSQSATFPGLIVEDEDRDYTYKLWINSIPNRYTRREAVEILAAAFGHAILTLTNSETEEEEEGNGMRAQSPAQRARRMIFFHCARSRR
jgi:hypothetical protein